MKIPDKIKIGGKIYAVEQTENLRLGALNCTGECDYENLKIRLVPYTCEGKKQADFIHEVVHAIADNLGYKQQDEQAVEAFAQALYAVIKDNPKMFKED